MVSIIIPTYNRDGTIAKSIDSVRNQTYCDIEIIVVDDGSTDDTEKIVQAIIRSDNRVRYLYQDHKGACSARNYGIDAARGDFIAFQDSDDVWRTDKLEKQMNVLNSMEDVDIVCSRVAITRLDGSMVISMKHLPEGIISNKIAPAGIGTQTLVIRKRVFQTVRFDEKVTRFQDLDLLLMAQKYFNIYVIAEVLVDRWIREDSITSDPERVYDMVVYFQNKHADIMKCRNQFMTYYFASLFLDISHESRGLERRKYMRKALEIDASVKTRIKYIIVRLHLWTIYKRISRFLHSKR